VIDFTPLLLKLKDQGQPTSNKSETVFSKRMSSSAPSQNSWHQSSPNSNTKLTRSSSCWLSHSWQKAWTLLTVTPWQKQCTISTSQLASASFSTETSATSISCWALAKSRLKCMSLVLCPQILNLRISWRLRRSCQLSLRWLGSVRSLSWWMIRGQRLWSRLENQDPIAGS